MAKYIKARCFKLTDDDWYGNYKIEDVANYPDGELKGKNKLVDVSLLTLGPGADQFRVCVWGNDDFGLELDFDSVFDAQAMYLKLLQLEVINEYDLKQLGFKRA